MTIHPSHDLPVTLSADQQATALTRTAKVLQELNKIRTSLDMPMEQLPLVLQVHDRVIDAMITENAREEAIKNCERAPLTMRSETRDYQPMKLVPGKKHVVVVRPQRRAFRPEDFTIHGDRSHWLIHDILIGNRTQLEAHHGPIPGNEFGPNGVCAHMSLETIQSAMDLELRVEYVGPELEGAVFEATVLGTASKI
jgi:hypothetical protein